MQLNGLKFLSDLVHAIKFGNTVGRKPELGEVVDAGRVLAIPPYRRLTAASDVLMKRIGDAARVAVAEQALEAYDALGSSEKLAYFQHLRDAFDANPDAIRDAFATYDADPSAKTLVPLFQAVEPPRQTLLRRMNTAPGATRRLVNMRADLLLAIRQDSSLAPIDKDFEHLFASWFNRGFLRVERIDWSTSAEILEKIISYETVHPMQGWDDLRRRLEPTDRRLYAFFHPATGNEPLIFVEVALMGSVPSEISPILTAPVQPEESKPPATTAVFYSINNTLPGLKGVSFGNFLIKQVVTELAAELPELENFVTLSPAPGFATWLENYDDPRAGALAERLKSKEWVGNPQVIEAMRSEVELFAATYLTSAKNVSGMPYDPVARFHLGNGASAWRANWPGNLAEGALSQSHGLMINYLYEPSKIETQHEAFVRDGSVAIGDPIAAVLACKPPKGTTE